MVKIFLLGVSHVRSFINEFIIPIYLGPGSDINLLNGYENLNKKLDDFINKKLFSNDDIVILNIGEESVRFLFRNELYPHVLNNKLWDTFYKNDIILFNKRKNMLDNIINKYIILINKIKINIPNLYILSAITSFYPINENLIYFNKKIEEYYCSKNYFNIFPNILNNITNYLNYNFKFETQKSEYKNHDFDPIHLNNNCANLFLETLNKDNNLNICISKNIPLKKHNIFECYML
jgi:hypothetical protein